MGASQRVMRSDGAGVRPGRMAAVVAVLGLLGGVLSVLPLVVGPVATAGATALEGTSFTPLPAPCRAVDTRSQAAGPVAGATASNAFGSRAFQVAGSGISGQGGAAGGCGVPDGASAVEVTVTVTGALSDGFLRVAPNTGATPSTTFINYRAGVGISNTGTVTLSNAQLQDLAVFNFAPSSTHVVIDVQGYFTGDSRPFIYDLLPNVAPVSGGTEIQVVGANFLGATAVAFGTVPATSFQVLSAELLTAVVPAGTGGVDVRVTNAAGSSFSSSTTEFNYTGGPVVSSLSLSTGPSTGGASVVLTGANFSGATAVTFDGVAATSFAVNSATQITATTPPGAGQVDVRVVAPSGTSPVVPAARHTYLDVLSVGDDHACAVVPTSGLVRCWGANSAGQLGNATTAGLGARTVIGDTGGRLTGAVQVATGADHTCVRLSNGQVRCWGQNGTGQLGTNSTTSTIRPVTVQAVGGGGSLTGVVQVAAGGTHSCALLTNGTARCWGNNLNGQLGDGTTTQRRTPVVVGGSTPLTGIVQLTAGTSHTCARTSGGFVACWGANGSGALGDGSTSQRLLPVVVQDGGAPLQGVRQVDAGDGTTCAVLETTGARCWGTGTTSQLGDGSSSNSAVPVTVGGGTPLTGIRRISAGRNHTCAALTSGGSRCWGGNSFGQLGTGSTSVSVGSPAQVAGLTGVGHIDAGRFFTCSAGVSVEPSCWGAGDNGKLGDGRSGSIDRSSPSAVVGFVGVVDVDAGDIHACAALSNGQARCWGQNVFGQLGNDSSAPSSNLPSVVQSSGVAPLLQVAQVSAAYYRSCAVLTSGQARCWGNNDLGELGDGSTTDRRVPVVVGGATALTGVVQISTGGSHTCAVLISGQARCWGLNNFGQLGDRTTTNRLTPVTVGGAQPLTDVIQISAGNNHTCARLVSGQARCWGANGSGSLGDNTATDRSGPVVVQAVGGGGALTGVADIAAGAISTCASLTSGEVRCWGENADGQLGDNSNVDRRVPVAVVTSPGVTLGTITQVSGENRHRCATSGLQGQLRCWGNNFYGQLGNGLTIDADTAGPVSTALDGSVVLAEVVQVAAGGKFSCARTFSGGALCWGDGVSGQLGTGSSGSSLIPVAVSGLP